MQSEKENIVELEKKIKQLRLEQKYEEALALCDVQNINIQLQKVKILTSLGQYFGSSFEECNPKNVKYLEEALDICNFYSNDNRFKEKIPKIQSMIRNYDPISIQLLTRIYFDYIDIDTIESSEIDDWKKDILKLVYYDKKQNKKILELIKKLKVKYNGDQYKIKVLNIIYSKIIDKKHIFDLMYYEKILGCHVDFEMKSVIDKMKEADKKQESQKELKVNQNSINVETKKKEDSSSKKLSPTPSIVSCNGVRSNNRYTNSNNQDNTKKSTNVLETNLLIKDIFPVETMAILKNVYAMMSDIEYRMMAVEAWDKFEVLINKSADDKDALRRMINLLERIQIRNQTVNPNYNHEKYQKLLSKN